MYVCLVVVVVRMLMGEGRKRKESGGRKCSLSALCLISGSRVWCGGSSSGFLGWAAWNISEELTSGR